MVKYDMKLRAGAGLRVRRADINDLPRMAEVFAAARRYMAANGNPSQWGDKSPDLALVKEDIKLGDSYVVTDGNGRIVATFALMKRPDPHYANIYDGPGWVESPVPYMTLHRVATDGSVRGMMPMIFGWAATCCDHLRIDTHADNKIMQHTILSSGFCYCGVITQPSGAKRNAYEAAL